jgi:hypothetical protein
MRWDCPGYSLTSKKVPEKDGFGGDFFLLLRSEFRNIINVIN